MVPARGFLPGRRRRPVSGRSSRKVPYRAVLGLGILWLALVPLAPQTSAPAHWWEKGPLRIIDLPVTPDLLAAFPPGELAAFKAGRSFNAEHLGGLELMGAVDDRGRFRPADKRSQDYLRAYLAAAKAKGIRTLIYFNVHSYPLDFGRRHPDWAQLKEDGAPITNVYETNTAMCYNTGYREWCFETLRNIARFPVDGVFYDGPIFYVETCYCPACRAKFQKRFGHAMPSKKIRTGAGARELLEFQAESLRDFLHDSRLALRGINPEAALYVNGGERGGNWATGRLNRILAPEQDLLGSEGGFLNGDLSRTPVWKPGVMARLLETQAPDKPRIIFSAGGHKPWTFSILPGPELKLLYAQTIANGAGVWFGAFAGDFRRPEMDAVTDMNRFLERNGRYFAGTVSRAETAVVWSEATANFYPKSSTPWTPLARIPANDDVGNPNVEFSGAVEALIRNRTPFDVIDEVRVEQGGLDRYRLIVLPNTACLSEKTARALEDYVRGGGSLLATFETSHYDETGVRRPDLLLGRLLGVKSLGRIIGPKRWDFMKRRADSPYLAGLGQEFLPSTLFNLAVRPTTAGVVLQFTAPLKGRYDGVPGLSDDPAFLVNSFGSGKAIYYSGDIGSCLQQFRLPEHFRLLGNVAAAEAPSAVKVQDAPGYLDIVRRSQDNGRRDIIHLLNFTGEMARPMSRIVPLRDVRVSFPGFGGASRVFALKRPQDLIARKAADGSWQVVLPVLEEYEVIVVER